MTTTEEILAQMLKENTGEHFLDSGGAYGRHWQRNQERDFEKEPETVLSFRYGEISITHNVYHWLKERLDYDEEGDDFFHGPFRVEYDKDDKSWLELMQDFPKAFAAWKSMKDSKESGDEKPCTSCDGEGNRPAPLSEDEDENVECKRCEGSGYVPNITTELYKATGLYGDTDEPITDNTYNHEEALSQTLQFTYFELSGWSNASYVLLQIHGGADVRGGYTKPRLFTLPEHDETAIFDYARGGIGCDEDHEHGWMTDDTCHWYYQGACGLGAGTQLDAYDTCQLLSNEDFEDKLKEDGVELCAGTGQMARLVETRELYASEKKEGKTGRVVTKVRYWATEWREDFLCWTEEGEGFCPLCGGKLSGGPY